MELCATVAVAFGQIQACGMKPRLQVEASKILAIPSEILIIKKRNWVTKRKSPLYVASPVRRSSSEVEQRIRNARVAGSIPAFGSTFSLRINDLGRAPKSSV